MGLRSLPSSTQHACPYPFYSETLPLPLLPNPLRGLLQSKPSPSSSDAQAPTLRHRREVWFEASTISDSQATAHLEPKSGTWKHDLTQNTRLSWASFTAIFVVHFSKSGSCSSLNEFLCLL
ncbi:hypothetical protein MRB53_021574 [Persea americana]|uniref:Uncharacterized protein n=1 Tax=Persea americana TaxID=3435 RepID=A0ACC2L4J0_PERAE|nr:hypothetical protein MRB53_021574 [Persea americana]